MWQLLIILILTSYIIYLRRQSSSTTRNVTTSSSSKKKNSKKLNLQDTLVKSLNQFVTLKYKQVIILRTDLKMKKGKMVAQGAHASLGAIKSILEGDESQDPLVAQWRKWKQGWEYIGTAKIALKVDSEEKLRTLREKAEEAGLPHYLVRDAGRTQVPNGSLTALAIGPAPVEKIDEITSHLKLL